MRMFSSLARRIASFALIYTSLLTSAAPALARAESDWPRELQTRRGRAITLYEPQFETLRDGRLTGRAAASIRAAAESEPVYGAFWFVAKVRIDDAARSVALDEIEVTEVEFPEMTPAEKQDFAATVNREFPRTAPTWSLQRTLASMEAAQQERAATAKLRNDAPEILVSETPAVLIQMDGEPRLRDVEDSGLQRIVNTPYFIVFDPAGKNYYLGSDAYWYQAKAPLGPWKVIANPPPNVLSLKPEDPAAAEPGGTKTMGAAPEVIVATQPTELIVIDGKPRFETVLQADLLYIANSDKAVFKDVASQDFYVVLSGRWYASPTLDGPWKYRRADKLPASFSKIPEGSPVAHVRASVAGTPEAEDALRSTQVPRVAAIDRRGASLEVTYDGEPRFASIPGTDLEYAVNTSGSVLRIGEKYYACHDAVWYVADDPLGPWDVSEERPEGVEAIPPENPLYNTKYVDVYEVAPNVVHAGYTAGYLGDYAYGGSVVYGTGHYYDPWYGSGYYPHAWTWGFGAVRTPWSGWGFGVGFGTGFLNLGWTWGGYYGWPAHRGYYGGYSGGSYCDGGWYGGGGYRPVYGTAATATTRYRWNYDAVRKFANRGDPYDRRAIGSGIESERYGQGGVRQRPNVAPSRYGRAYKERDTYAQARERAWHSSGDQRGRSEPVGGERNRSAGRAFYRDRGGRERSEVYRSHDRERARVQRPMGADRGDYSRSRVRANDPGAGGSQGERSSGAHGLNRGGGAAPSRGGSALGRGGGGGSGGRRR